MGDLLLRSWVVFFGFVLVLGVLSMIYALRAIERGSAERVGGYLAFGVAGIICGMVGCIAFAPLAFQ